MAVFRIPQPDQRTTIIGKTGSGKTQAGAFLLAHMPFDQVPWVIFDFKREKLFMEIEPRELSLETERDWAKLNQPGLFIVRPRPDQEAQVETLLWHIWDKEYCGVYVDEGSMFEKSKPYEALLTQGRSKNIPVITLTQRPVWITKFAFSEADYLQIFRLNTEMDRKTVGSYIDSDVRDVVNKRLPDFYSYWYDAAQGKVVVLRPVPDRQWIIATLRARLAMLQQTQRAKSFV